ncbi:Plant self-incompatibility S1 [Macleaya cordata]|uniref:S-protein homolog n=1 Tax=Macleaya cordata TaxID=56857 RepID=A0A200Q9G0_MACCD|nr:Plant self-incompatibility S1 [Macleaya cordata]OVA18541.1 Plant self-incompatibility S1 [Macleaya cordata]
MAGGRGPKQPISLLLLFLVLALSSSSWCPSAYGTVEINYYQHSQKITVWVYNELDPNTTLTIHCKSKDDDLGEHTLSYNQEFHWKFRINFFWTTLFWCNMWWHDSNGRLVQASHDAYFVRRDYEHYCVADCFWSIQKDGWYYGNHLTLGKLMFTWDKQIQ